MVDGVQGSSGPLSQEAGGLDVAAEARLLARLKAGENSAFEELIRSVGARMFAVARRMLPSDDDAADAVQDAFVSAFRALPNFDGRSRLSTWLHRITVNACLMKLRTRRRKPERVMSDLLPKYLEDGHQDHFTPVWKPPEDVGIEPTAVAQLVREKIDELPDQYREVLILRDVEELSTEDASVVLGITVSAVKTRLHRARQALRTLLEPAMTARGIQ